MRLIMMHMICPHQNDQACHERVWINFPECPLFVELTSGHRYTTSHWFLSNLSWKCLQHVDEPHGSLFMYFRIFTPLADDHVIVSHVTGVTWPILTFSDQLQSFPIILPLANILWALQTLIEYHTTLQKFYSSVKQLLRTPACRHIKIARLRQLTTLAQWFRDIVRVMR